ncbi:MAG: alpha/beta hydrolase [Nitrospinae bacterium]|nr:alpha/beta hydrolase [Nitrospinota bacterium]
MFNKTATAAYILACVLALPAWAGEVHLRHGGLELNANLEPAPGGSINDGPVILMAHGTMGHNGMETISTLQKLFGENGISSLAINLSLSESARHGMYPCENLQRHRHEDAVGEIFAWVEWLKARGVKDIYLFGHSRGASQVALVAGKLTSGAVKGAILLAPITWESKTVHENYLARRGKPLEPLLAHAQALISSGKPEAVLEKTGFLHCAETNVTAGSFVSYYGGGVEQDTPSLLSRVNTPVLVIAGSNDDVVGDLVERVKPHTGGGKIKLVIVDGADHFFRDIFAYDVADAVKSFTTGK